MKTSVWHRLPHHPPRQKAGAAVLVAVRLRKPFGLAEKVLAVPRRTHLPDQSESTLLVQEQVSFCMTSGLAYVT